MFLLKVVLITIIYVHALVHLYMQVCKALILLWNITCLLLNQILNTNSIKSCTFHLTLLHRVLSSSCEVVVH